MVLLKMISQILWVEPTIPLTKTTIFHLPVHSNAHLVDQLIISAQHTFIHIIFKAHRGIKKSVLAYPGISSNFVYRLPRCPFNDLKRMLGCLTPGALFTSTPSKFWCKP